MRLASDESATRGGRRVLVLISRSVHGWQAPLDLVEEITHRDLQSVGLQRERRLGRVAVAPLDLRNEALRERESQLRLCQAEFASASADDRAQPS